MPRWRRLGARRRVLATAAGAAACLAVVKSVDPEVYDLWLKGSYYAQRLTKSDRDTAERYDALALARDPASALVHAGLSGLWVCRQQMDVVLPRDTGPKAKASAYAGPLFGWPDVPDAVRKGYAEAGYAAALRRRAADLETAKHGDEPGVAIDAAMNDVMGADCPRALDWLEKAYEQRDPNPPYANCFPLYDPLRADPRFQAILRRMGLLQ